MRGRMKKQGEKAGESAERDEDRPIFEGSLGEANLDETIENLKLVALAQSCLYYWDSDWSVLSR